ncbi:MAG: glycerophosphoryl diester phosphodiesterase membrane domain-containing protein [Lachnospiraceae bacterium]|nr:glycerophosphoryl diester phosphodiesterase membrane domain-containing protein [Lachnospiraceae bacterium]
MHTRWLALRLFFKNFISLLGFELTYKPLALLIVCPLLVYVFNASIRMAGYTYLSNDNLFRFLEAPSTIVVFLILLIILMAFYLFEMLALTGTYHASFFKHKLKTVEIYRMGLKHLGRALKPQNFHAVVWVFFLLLAINMIYLAGLFRIIRLPGFVTSYLERHKLTLIILAVLMLLLSMLAVLRLYCLQNFVIEKKNIFRSKQKSRRMIQGHYGKTILNLILWNALIVIGNLLLYRLAIWTTAEIASALGTSRTLQIITLKSSGVFVWVMIGSYFLFFIPLNILFISTSYYRKKEMAGEVIEDFVPLEPITKNQKRTRKTVGITVGILVLNSICMFLFYSDEMELRAELFQVPTVMAHRGDSSLAPENTMAAFEAAMDDMADWIELDVQMTKDGVVVVTHDTNLKRVTGLNKNIWEVEYKDICGLDAGGWFSADYEDECIPTLEEVLAYTDGEIRLNIEMKPNGRETGFEEEVIRLVREYDVEDSCMICCMQYKTLERIKKLAPEIETTYVLIMAYADFWKADAADSFSISYGMLDKNVVANIKNIGKDVYVWTVNTKEQMLKAIDMGVDGLITDYPLLAEEMILSRYTPEEIIELIEEDVEEIMEDLNEVTENIELERE